jgi:hypothetical protein
MATPASNKPRPQRKDASNKLDSAAQKMGIKDGKTAMNMMGQGKAYDNYYNPSRVAKPMAKPKESKSTLQKIGGAVKGAVTGAVKGLDDYATGTNAKGQPVISAPIMAPVTAAVGAIRGGYLGAKGEYSAPKTKNFTSSDYPVAPKVAPDRANNPTRVTGSGPSMNKAMPASKYTPVPMPTPTFKSNGGRTAVPMPAPKGPKSKYTPVPMPTPKFGR